MTQQLSHLCTGHVQADTNRRHSVVLNFKWKAEAHNIYQSTKNSVTSSCEIKHSCHCIILMKQLRLTC